jgi:hypothetical protein
MWPGTFAMKEIESNRNLSDFLKDYRYQPELTGRLDRLDSQPFTQAVVNEIVLWKVNRYTALSPATLDLLNNVVGLQAGLHRAARDVILALLGERGVVLPMLSGRHRAYLRPARLGQWRCALADNAPPNELVLSCNVSWIAVQSDAATARRSCSGAHRSRNPRRNRFNSMWLLTGRRAIEIAAAIIFSLWVLASRR